MALAPVSERLDEARDARHRLLIGQMEVEVEVDGFKATFQKTDLARLNAYIAQLEVEAAGQAQRGAIGIRF